MILLNALFPDSRQMINHPAEIGQHPEMLILTVLRAMNSWGHVNPAGAGGGGSDNMDRWGGGGGSGVGGWGGGPDNRGVGVY